ncbi:MAG: hypothetical protein FJX77_11930 [Armatimonadetes bacterium]|nr:hypothetical protein [Armatimonadota bacterium]
MYLKRLGLAAMAALVGLATTGAPALADHDRYDRRGDRYDRRDRYDRNDRYDRVVRYRDWNYPCGYDRPEISRREILRSRLFHLSDRVRLAEREGTLGRREADRLFARLDRVCDFLRDDRYLTDQEFSRRQRDLEQVEDDLQYYCRGYDRRGYYR